MSGEVVSRRPWGGIGASSRGAKRQGTHTPNQDAFGIWRVPGGGLVACISDGHGGSAHPRSHVGSRTAIEVARAVTTAGEFNPLVDKEQFPEVFLKRWRERIARDVLRHPLTPREVAHGVDATRIILAPVTAYGATLSMVILTQDHLLEFTLGDGSISCAKGESVRFGGSCQDESLGDETHSLCLERASELFVCSVSPADDLDAVILCTDGVQNSFRSTPDFLKLTADLTAMVRDRAGRDELEEELPRWLSEYSREGSGDDATLVVLYRHEPLQNMIPHEPSKRSSPDASRSRKTSALRRHIRALTGGFPR